MVSILLDHTEYFQNTSLVIYVFLSIHWMAVLIIEWWTWHSSHLALGNSLTQSVLSGPRRAFICCHHLQTPYDFMLKKLSKSQERFNENNPVHPLRIFIDHLILPPLGHIHFICSFWADKLHKIQEQKYIFSKKWSCQVLLREETDLCYRQTASTLTLYCHSTDEHLSYASLVGLECYHWKTKIS